ncbi:hypothetical protein [Vibrio sp. RM-69-4]|uniref:hypothetical protein n=1 Tax=Vibrio sp. RM-69-4 TaxID=2950157 RepID=UPI00215D0F52|nr:hypothetical protein [Vibrio sp. RM-69-4]MCR9423790.1 hypothetical protein [Vibrio sp. RM-69-4]
MDLASESERWLYSATKSAKTIKAHSLLTNPHFQSPQRHPETFHSFTIHKQRKTNKKRHENRNYKNKNKNKNNDLCKKPKEKLELKASNKKTATTDLLTSKKTGLTNFICENISLLN